jgi:hypothetical protein
MSEDLSADLLHLLGDDGFFTLTEAYPGIRLYVPVDISNSELPKIVGNEVAERLVRRYGSDYISVPVAREFRALRRRSLGLGNREIARQLGVGERAIERLFARVKNKRPEKLPPKPRKKDPRQIEMF